MTTIIKVQYRFTFLQFAKWKGGFISVDPSTRELTLTDDLTNKIVFRSPVGKILYGFAGKNFIIMGNRKRCYLNFDFDDNSISVKEAGGVAIGAAGASAGVPGSGVVAASQQSINISKKKRLIKSSKGYQALEKIFSDMGAIESRKPGKAAVRTTYIITLLITFLVFLPSLGDPLALFSLLIVAIPLIIMFELSE